MANTNAPQTLDDFLKTYPDGFWQLGAVLRSKAWIVQDYARREGIDYPTAVSCLVSEHFCCRYPEYLAKWNSEQIPDFLEYAKILFVFRVRASNSRAVARRRRAEEKHGETDTRPLEDILCDESEQSGIVRDCPAVAAIRGEENAERERRLAVLSDLLQGLDSVASFIAWQHTGQGTTYARLADYLGTSPTSVKAIHAGAIATLRRQFGVKPGS